MEPDSNKSDLTEEKLREIIDVGKAKVIQINGERKYLSTDTIAKLKQKQHHSNTKTGGLFPLIPILAGILGATAAAAGTASGIASTVSNSRDAYKKKLETDMLIEKRAKTEQSEAKTQAATCEGFYYSKNIDPINDGKGLSNLGGGLYFDPYFGKGLKDSILNSNEYKTRLEKQERTQLKQVLNKMCKAKRIKITTQGRGLFLDPYDSND